MLFPSHDDERRFRDAWESVRIERPVHYSLFTFGESVLPYYLVSHAPAKGEMVSLTHGEVRISRPTIITPDNARPEFRNFFDEHGDEGIVDFLLARTAGFSHLQFENTAGSKQLLSDSVEEVVARLNRKLDEEEEDRVAILSSPPELNGVALMRFAVERVIASSADNVQELRERGFLP
jgi:hypothetical protein